jgi:hypothetical protein
VIGPEDSLVVGKSGLEQGGCLAVVPGSVVGEREVVATGESLAVIRSEDPLPASERGLQQSGRPARISRGVVGTGGRIP